MVCTAGGSFSPLSSFSQPHFLLISALCAAALSSASPALILRSRRLCAGATNRGCGHTLSCLIWEPSGEGVPVAGLLSRSPFSSMQTLSLRTSSSSSSSALVCSCSSVNHMHTVCNLLLIWKIVTVLVVDKFQHREIRL